MGRLGWGLALILVTAGLTLCGLALCLWAFYGYLQLYMPRPTARLITGIVTLLLALLSGRLAWRLTR